MRMPSRMPLGQQIIEKVFVFHDKFVFVSKEPTASQILNSLLTIIVPSTQQSLNPTC